ncbi:MAG: hypothetical protein ACI9OJ_000214 [Myxococcota bacterium]|jgi:hypothetical protein
MRTTAWAGLCLLLTTTWSLSASGQYREESAPAQGLGLADAVRSSATGPTALYFNPAGMHQMLHYAIEAGYTYNQAFDSHAISASIVDSATNEHIAAGFGYAYITGSELADADSSRSGHLIRGALASGYRFDGGSVHLGVGIRYLSLSIGEDGSAEAFTMDTGLMIVYQNMIRFGIVGHNLLETDVSETPRRLGTGISLFTSGLLVGFDVVMDFETLESTEAKYNVGIEYTAAGIVPIRLGYTNDQVFGGRQLITGGIGYVSRVVAADFSFGVNPTDSDDAIFSFNARFFVP